MDEGEEQFYDLPFVRPPQDFDEEFSLTTQDYLSKKLNRAGSPIKVLVEDEERRVKTDFTPEIKRKTGNIEELSEEEDTELSFC